MHKKKIAVMTMAIIISNFSATTLEVLADEVKNNSTAIEQNVIEEPNIATIKKFDLLNNKKLEEYDKSFIICIYIVTVKCIKLLYIGTIRLYLSKF